MTTATPVSRVDCRVLSCTLLNICQHLPDGFCLQDVIDRVLVEAPELLEDLPRVWAYLRADEHVQCCGIDGAHYRLSKHYVDRDA